MRRTRLAVIFCSALLLASPAIAHDAEGAKPAPPLPDTTLPAPLHRVLRDWLADSALCAAPCTFTSS